MFPETVCKILPDYICVTSQNTALLKQTGVRNHLQVSYILVILLQRYVSEVGVNFVSPTNVISPLILRQIKYCYRTVCTVCLF
jgi:hypothetical protein